MTAEAKNSIRRQRSKSTPASLKDILEKVYAKYNHRSFIKSDPLQFAYRYKKYKDREIAAFLSAELAYGRVQQIEKSLIKLFGLMGESPFDFVTGFDNRKRDKLKDFKHRFTSGDDISDLLFLLKKVYQGYGSIEKFFVLGCAADDENIVPALAKFCDRLLKMHSDSYNGSVPKGLSYLLPRPEAGSACKRLNLFLRWMVRDDDVDPGLWKSIDKARLIVPVDVHMGRLCGILGLDDRKTVSLAGAVKITRGFAEIEPSDPVKYDFSLSRIGILDNCTGKHRQGCQFCELFAVCLHK